MATFRVSLAAVTDKVAGDALKNLYDQIDVLNSRLAQLSSQASATAKKVADTQAATVQAQAALSTVSGFATLIAGSSSPIKNGQASVLNAFTGTFAYTSTTSSITWYWDGTNGSSVLTILWPDGTKTPIPPSNLAITGLSANTTYIFYPYWSNTFRRVQFVTLPVALGSPAVAFGGNSPAAAALAFADGNVGLALSAMTAATPTSGSGGGSGGGGGGGGSPLQPE